MHRKEVSHRLNGMHAYRLDEENFIGRFLSVYQGEDPGRASTQCLLSQTSCGTVVPRLPYKALIT